MGEHAFSHELLGLAALAYFASGTAYLWFLARGDDMAAQVGAIALSLGLVLHGGAVLLELVHYRFAPATNVKEGLSLLAWLMGLTFLVINRRLKLPILGAFVMPLMLAVALPALALPGRPRPLPPALHDTVLFPHVLSAFFGDAVFGLAALVGLAYLLQERELKSRVQASALWARLPSLELMDRLNRRLVVAGFALFSLAIVTGAVLAQQTWGSAFGWEPSELVALLTWLVYAGLIWARFQAGWQGRRAAVLTLVGFGLSMVGLVGLGFFPDRHGGTFQ
jgi:cytochrome c-type biogenesis protein CcsB